MKFFTGSLAAGLVLLAGSAQAQVPGPLHGGIGCRGPLCGGAAPGSRAAHSSPGRATDTARACCRRRKSTPCCATTVSRRSASPGCAASSTPSRCIDRGGADGRLIIDARNGRIIRFMPAYRDGRRQLLRGAERAPRALGAQPPQAQPPQAQTSDQVQAAPRPSRPAHVASRAVPMPKASPLAAKPAPAPVQQAAAPAPKSAEAQAAAPPRRQPARLRPSPRHRLRRPGKCRRRRGWSEFYRRPCFRSDDNQKNAPVSRGVFAFSQYRPKTWSCVTRRPRRRPPAGLSRRS